MTKTKGFTIEVSSPYEGWWRYNVTLMCGCFDKQQNRIGFTGIESHVADVGANLKEKPAGATDQRCILLETIPCEYLMLYIYIVPHTLPCQNEIGDTLPFEVTLNISYKGKQLDTRIHRINQWSGASIEVKVPSSPVP